MLEVINGNEEEIKFFDTAITLGKFDGFHKGHKLLIDEIIKEKLTSIIFTFKIDKNNKYIYTKEEKKKIAEDMGVDIMIEYPFDKSIKNMTPETFIKDVLCEKLNAKKIVVGEDFKFGYNRTGNVEILKKMAKKYSYELVEVKRVKNISSTLIKEELLRANMDNVRKMLGRNYTIEGTIEHGNAIGRTIGIPTINIIPAKEKIVPKNGVYASKIFIDGKAYRGITNIGYKPTIAGEKVLGIETNIFDFSKDVYGKEAKVELLEYIREERKFKNIEELVKQMKSDIKLVKERGSL